MKHSLFQRETRANRLASTLAQPGQFPRALGLFVSAYDSYLKNISVVLKDFWTEALNKCRGLHSFVGRGKSMKFSVATVRANKVWKKKGKVLFRFENGFLTALVRGITLHSTSENDCSAEIVLTHSIFSYAQRNIWKYRWICGTQSMWTQRRKFFLSVIINVFVSRS